MFSKVQIVNFGLSKIAASPISRIDPPQSSLERHISAGYEHWKRTELVKRRWVFAVEMNHALAEVEVLEGVERSHKYSLPVECLRPVRTRYTEWRQSGRYLYSAEAALRIEYIRNASETEFDPMFVEVLACRVALETVEYATQSNTKKADIKALYDEAVAAAGKNNAFVIGPEDIGADDGDFSFITSRF